VQAGDSRGSSLSQWVSTNWLPFLETLLSHGSQKEPPSASTGPGLRGEKSKAEAYTENTEIILFHILVIEDFIINFYFEK
jgi:hypothetical protein